MDFFADFTMTIDGAAAEDVERFDVLNPARETVMASAPDCTESQLDRAIVAARKAFKGWSSTPIEQRRERLGALAKALEENSESLGRLLSMEQGKSFSDAKLEVDSSAGLLRAQCMLEIPTHTAEDGPDRIVETHHVPIGVVGAIAPWNFPILIAMFKIGPGLLTGNTLVLKPSPFTPLTTLKLGELARAVLPAGVLNIVSGGDRLGPWLTSHPGINKVSFTGSSPTGKRVMASAAATLKRVTLELGGNDAAIVMPDVDVEAVAPLLFWSAFGNNGQICIATKRMYIHESIYDAMAAALVAYAKSIKTGDGSLPDTQLGPINNRPQYERVLSLLADARARGYKFLVGGETRDGPGYFIPVSLIDNPPEDSRIVREEQFGPVLPLLKFSSVDEVISRANDSEFGLAGSVWAGDETAAIAIAQRLATGTVFINQTQYLSPFATFGGHKQSGLGAEGGVEGLLEYMNPQTFVRPKKAVA